MKSRRRRKRSGRKGVSNPKRQDANQMGSARLLERNDILLAIVLVVLTFAAYIPAMTAGAVWDDTNMLFGSRIIRSDHGLRDIWFSNKLPDYWPITYTTFFLEWRLWGENTTPYHLVNITLHAAAAVVLWRVLRRLSVSGAWVSATIFALHPVAVTSVAWISERKNTLSMLLVALAVWAYLRFEQNRENKWYVSALLLFLLALMSKTSVVMIPVVLLLIIWWQGGRLTKSHLIRITPFFVLSLILGIVTVLFQAIDAAHFRPEGMASRLAAAGWCFWFYLHKTLLPVQLSIIYPRWDVDTGSMTAWLPLVGIFVVAAVAWYRRRKWGRNVLVVLGCHVMLLAPVLGLVQMSFHQYSLVADHLQYIALIVPIAVVVALINKALSRMNNAGWARRALPMIVIVPLSLLTWQRASAFDSNYALWTDTLQKNPNAWAAHNNLGDSARQRNEPDKAMLHYRKALEINPSAAKPHNNLAGMLRGRGEIDDAMAHYKKALEIDPHYARANYNLAGLYQAFGKLELSVEHYQRAIKIEPDYANAHNNLGIVLRKLGRIDEAIDHYRRAIDIVPEDALAHNNLGNALRIQGHVDEGLVHHRMALVLRPEYAEAHLAIGVGLQAKGESAEALMHYRQALVLKGEWVAALHRTAALLAGTPGLAETTAEAVQMAERAAALTQHRNPVILRTLAECYAASNRYSDAVEIASAALKLLAEDSGGHLANQIRLDLAIYEERGASAVNRPG